VKTGDFIKKTTDIFTSYGREVFLNTNRTILEQDATTVTDMKKSMSNIVAS